MKSKKLVVSIITIFISITIISCGLLGSSDEAAVDALSEQVALLSTQNAALLEKIEDDDNAAEAANTENEGVNAPAATEEPTEFVIPSATPESLPTEPVMAGTPIIYDGWSIMVSKEYYNR